MSVKGVIFDMDGLIFDTEQLYYAGAQAAADTFGFPYDKELYLNLLGISDEEVIMRYHELFDEKFGVDTVTAFIEAAYENTRLLFAQGKVTLKPGVMELLTYLKANKIKWVIASSNQRAVIDELLEQAELTAYFSTVVSAEDVPKAKPDPAIFLAAQNLLGTKKEETLVLEDSQNGVLAAYRAEIPVIMVPDLLPPDADLKNKTVAVVSSLHEVPKFLA
ncbi:HAD family hydrolase [Enterococcus dispar]|uniref:HAD family hydrolase n=1 Tax=Enterococcus dispar TaxID=44009 RepID=UPI0021D42BB1|nr:HAD family phosphatase [Enterococcus dispar]MCU7356756.1 HAD family phosphatase [Enterococcus dispar]MDT2706727.1 HAD family phosphatase [Enterococcus dispar]